MDEYIKRADAIKAIKRQESADSFDFNQGLISAMNAMDEITAADVVEVKHGEWKHRKSWMRNVCSVCSFESIYATNYCPNCGAKMDGGADE